VSQYYSIDRANERLGEVRPILERLRQDRRKVADAQRVIVRRRQLDGDPEHAAAIKKEEDKIRTVIRRMQRAVAKLNAWDVQLRDIETGLIDFPALASGRPIWLCWRFGEDDIGWWHEANAGFDSRKPLAELT
jgi:hypothetical protein